MFILESIKQYAKTNRVAQITREGRLTFAELDAKSGAFAAWLMDTSPDNKAPVLIYGAKEIEFLPCVFGALKSGRAYIPVDTVMPPTRAAEIAREAAPGVVVDFSASGIETGAVLLDREDVKGILNASDKTEVPRANWVSGEDTAYILFTSGSTGKPKGVPVTAANLAAFNRGLLPHMNLPDEGVILDQVSYSFDVSCCSIYTGLSRGMTLLSIDKVLTGDPAAMFERLRGSGITNWVSTPSFAELCVRAKGFTSELLPELKEFLFCGEVLTNGLCGRLAERFPEAGILNTYGPTEATVLVTAVSVSAEMLAAGCAIPIGRPILGTELRIVDVDGNILEGDGQSGELLIIGDSVGPGYLNRPGLTEKSFFLDEIGRRGYRTGDLAMREDGHYFFQGRIDNQLKLGGYRVEVEDIELNLTRVENVSRAAVVPVWKDGQVQSLAAFVLLERDDGLSALNRTIAVKKAAASFLPAYMIPRRIIAVKGFPLNQNGKIDKKELGKML